MRVQLRFLRREQVLALCEVDRIGKEPNDTDNKQANRSGWVIATGRPDY